MRTILSYEEADQILNPLYSTLTESVTDAMKDYNLCLDFASRNLSLPQKFVPATKSILIWNFIINHVREKFSENPSIKPHIHKRVFGLLIHNSIFIRFKKIDKKGNSFNIETNNSKSLNSQGELDSFPEKPTILKFGWIPDKSNTLINDINIICNKTDGGVLWKIDVTEKIKLQYLFPPTEVEVSPKIDRLLKINEQIKQNKKYGNS